MSDRTKQEARSRLFLFIGVLGVLVAVAGFSKTFFYPLLTGTFSAHPLIYVHGLFLFGWVGFFLWQSQLIHRRRLRVHKNMGWLGGSLAAGVVLSTLAVAVLASRRIAASGEVGHANGELLVVMIEMTMFAALITSALVMRKRPETHKRLMLLALIGSLGPAWFRFRHYFPEVGNPLFLYSILLADSLILVAALSDLIRRRSVHWVYIVVGSSMVAVHLVEVFLFDTRLFRAIAGAVAGPFV